MLNVSQSLLHPDQYRFGIKSPVLLYLSEKTTLTIARFYNQLTQPITLLRNLSSTTITTTTIQLETALCYQHYFCNTELRTAIITEIKGLSIQTQQNTFVLFYII